MGGKEEKSSRAGGGQCAEAECRELHGGSGVLGCGVLLPTLAKLMLQETQTPEKAHDVVGIPSNRVVQMAGGNWTVHHPPTPRSCCLELVYCVVILSITRTHTLRLVLRQKAKRTRWTLETGPLRSWPFSFSEVSKVRGHFLHLQRFKVIASKSTILPLFRCILLT